ncbi:MAG: hypothetical protein QOG43_1248, partial [Actinomycetota bacterium]|nr:hypothetical protein [Actinomycetota bacterium]
MNETRGRGRLLLAGAALLVGTLCATVVPADAAAKAPAKAPATGAAPVSGCGATVLRANGTPWVCTLAENFDGTSLNRARWVPQTSAASGFGSQDDCYVDDPDNVAVAGGTLKLTVRKEAAPFTCTTPASTYST